jgi:hypothetical protein
MQPVQVCTSSSLAQYIIVCSRKCSVRVGVPQEGHGAEAQLCQPAQVPLHLRLALPGRSPYPVWVRLKIVNCIQSFRGTVVI